MSMSYWFIGAPEDDEMLTGTGDMIWENDLNRADDGINSTDRARLGC